jgi:hypothetical protein
MAESLQRIGFLKVVPDLLREDAIDPDTVLSDVGLEPDGLDDPERMI